MERPTIKVLLVENDREDYVIARDLPARIKGGEHAVEWITDFEAALDAALRKAHDELELRAGERSAQLFETVSLLRAEIAQREESENALLAAHDELSKNNAILEQSQERYRQLADAMPQIVWTANPDGGLDYYNQRWFDYTGMTLEQTEGWGWEPVLHPDDVKNCVEVWNESVRTGEYYQIEYRFKRGSDNSYRWHLGRAMPVRDESGQIVKWFGTCTDIEDYKRVADELVRTRAELENRVARRTASLSAANAGLEKEIAERKQAENALAKAAQRERVMIENVLDIICTVDAEGRFVTVSPACFKVWGYQPEELIGQKYIDLVAPEDVDKTNKIALKIMSGKETSNFENRYMHKDGSFVEVMWASFWSEKEQMMFAVAHDNTERKRAEERLRGQRNFTHAITNNIGEGIYALDPEGRVTFMNPAAEKIFGWREDELLGKSIHESVHYQHPDGTPFPVEECPLLKVLTNGDCIHLEDDAFTHRDGTIILVSCTSSPLVADGRIVGAVLSFHDITERRQIEAEQTAARDAALESARMKSEFLANMSHEIRTPMNGVIGMTGLLLETDLSDRQKEFTKAVESSADALLLIIDDILDFSKIEAGQLRFEKIDFDLRGTVEQPVELLAERAQTKGIEIASLVFSDVPTALRGDPGRLRQVLTNLIGNAVKFTEKGEVVVSVFKQSETEKHVELRFEIKDTGIGIAPEARRRLFQAFVQADGSMARKYGGTGLGLAISKQLAEMMGGEIGVESVSGAGSTFWFTARFEKQPPPPKAPARTAAGISLERVRVLIVDDNETNRSILFYQTASWGMIGAEAESGARALSMLKAAAADGEPFEIAVLDLMMPEMDGFELARAVKSDASISGTRLVLLPSYGKRGHGQTAAEAGIAAYLQKPVRQSQLYDCLITLMAETDAVRDKEQSTHLITKHSLRNISPVPDKTSGAAAKARILVAEDNAVNRKVALAQLESLGYAADVASNGWEALDALEKSRYDVVLMDCQMPEMDGFEATAEVRRREQGDSPRTVIVAMTANALEGDRRKCLAAGMDDYISKPVKIDALRQVLERWTVSAPGKKDASPEKPPDSPEKAASEIIDFSVLEGFRGFQPPGEPDLVDNLIDLFTEDTAGRLAILKQAAADADAAAINREAHNVKGAAGNIGAGRMAEICRELEQKASQENEAKALISRLESEFKQVVEVLNSMRQPLKG